MKKQWAKFVLVMVCYLLFLFWVKSWLGLLVIPFIYDAYISKKINWKWWQDYEGPMRTVMSWVDAIVFALVAVYFINQFFFQNYVIPSSSLEKSLLTGDYLFVSKVSYGPRIPETPLTVPLTQQDLAKLTNLSQRTISSLENGNDVSFSTIIEVLRALGRLQSLESMIPEQVIRSSQIAKLGKPRERSRPKKAGSGRLEMG